MAGAGREGGGPRRGLAAGIRQLRRSRGCDEGREAEPAGQGEHAAEGEWHRRAAGSQLPARGEEHPQVHVRHRAGEALLRHPLRPLAAPEVPRAAAPARPPGDPLGDSHRHLRPGLALDPRLHLLGDQLDAGARRYPLAGEHPQLQGRPRPGDALPGGDQRLARVPLHHRGDPRWADLHPRRDPRAGPPGRGQRPAALLLRDGADGAAHSHGLAALLGGVLLHRLQHHLDHHPRRALRSDAGALHLRVPGRRQRGLPGQGGRRLALPLPHHGLHGLRHAPVPPQGEHVNGAPAQVSLWRTIRQDVFSWAFLLPFLAFALFPFYWGVITSFKADANLYDLTRNPLWISKIDGRTGKPYHKEIIVPASYREAAIKWQQPLGSHTDRSDAEADPKPVALVGDQPIFSPVSGSLARVDVKDGEIARPNTVVGDIEVENPTVSHYKFLAATPFYRWMQVSLLTGLAVVVITLIVAVPAAYSLARLNFRGNRGIGIAIFLTYLIPPTILFIPFSQLVGGMHIDN